MNLLKYQTKLCPCRYALKFAVYTSADYIDTSTLEELICTCHFSLTFYIEEHEQAEQR